MQACGIRRGPKVEEALEAVSNALIEKKRSAAEFDSHARKHRDKGQLGFSFKGNASRSLSPLRRRGDDGHMPSDDRSTVLLNGIHSDLERYDSLDVEHSSLSGKVLILNGNYEPLAICNVQKAIILLYLNKADMVSAVGGKAVHSASASIPFPSVIRLSNYVRVPFKKVILSRKNILRRDGHKCQYCGASSISLTVDHIMPKSRGGEDSWENLVSACLRCNNRKGSHTPDEAEMPLMKRPIRPNHVTFLRQYVGKVGKDWEPFLFM
jgi:5-methylcytosine-specific restriction endonuclease McrA